MASPTLHRPARVEGAETGSAPIQATTQEPGLRAPQRSRRVPQATAGPLCPPPRSRADRLLSTNITHSVSAHGGHRRALPILPADLECGNGRSRLCLQVPCCHILLSDCRAGPVCATTRAVSSLCQPLLLWPRRTPACKARPSTTFPSSP